MITKLTLPIDLKQLESSFDYMHEGLFLEATESLYAAMEAQGLDCASLAAKIGWPTQTVTKIFRGTLNLTLARLVKMAMALGLKIHLSAEKT
jgi:ribosome-binding protein aMBF1 (putative translation factor)